MDGEMPPRTSADRPFEDEVQLVSTWVIFTAFAFVVNYAIGYAFDHYHAPCSQGFFLRCNRLTDAEAAEETAIVIGMMCCAALQAAAAALSLRLPCRRPWARRALAYLALVLATAGHCMYARGVRLNLAADPEDVYYKTFCNVAIVVFAVGDYISFLALLAD